MIDHVTVQVAADELRRSEMDEFLDLIEMREVEPDHRIEGAGWDVRWWKPEKGDAILHLVGANRPARTGLGHFCLLVSRDSYERCLRSKFLEHYSGRIERCWIEHAGIRVEVRPNGC